MLGPRWEAIARAHRDRLLHIRDLLDAPFAEIR
jgi:hypothetical protein